MAQIRSTYFQVSKPAEIFLPSQPTSEMHFPERLFYLNSFTVIFVPLQYRWELTSHENCPNSKQQEQPELSLNRAEVTEQNRKLKLGFSHSRKENGGVRRDQKAHVLHSNVPVVGEHTSLFLLSSACSGEQLNNSSQLPGTTGDRSPFIFLPHETLRNTAANILQWDLLKRATAETPWIAYVSKIELTLNFVLYSPLCF